MFFNFSFWRYVTNPSQLALNHQSSAMRGFNIRIVFLFLSGIVIFALRDIWGMTTESLSPMLATATYGDYTIARFVSVIGSALWAIVYISFHLYVVSYILGLLTSIPVRRIVPLQLLVTGVLLIEKALVFLVFAVKGEATNVSFLSFGPLTSTFSDIWFLVMFLNQLTLITALIVSLQFSFIRTYTKTMNWKSLLAVLIGLQIVFALLTTAVGYIPFERLFNYIVSGGAA
ncbi:hypothetical protein [Sporosarcina aquimarina]|uniref:Yip1 domain-containing protein n=1 Tax=Sporosarcina aquimarina TaxID=114975 RepID=A0ABU4FVJ0_9BACL|nr:hypothetical protein [Sporosarcina aquimarina]MDW0108671.1 hypothetical protein [Sporosarcina aquimarina]